MTGSSYPGITAQRLASLVSVKNIMNAKLMIMEILLNMDHIFVIPAIAPDVSLILYRKNVYH